MKKSNTLFTLAFFAILAFSSCEREQWGNAGQRISPVGKLSFKRIA